MTLRNKLIRLSQPVQTRLGALPNRTACSWSPSIKNHGLQARTREGGLSRRNLRQQTRNSIWEQKEKNKSVNGLVPPILQCNNFSCLLSIIYSPWNTDPPLWTLLLCWKRYLFVQSPQWATPAGKSTHHFYGIIKLKNLGQNLTWIQTQSLLNLSSSLRVNLFLTQPQKLQQDLSVPGKLKWTPKMNHLIQQPFLAPLTRYHPGQNSFLDTQLLNWSNQDC